MGNSYIYIYIYIYIHGSTNQASTQDVYQALHEEGARHQDLQIKEVLDPTSSPGNPNWTRNTNPETLNQG